jgi:hypothetical protein
LQLFKVDIWVLAGGNSCTSPTPLDQEKIKIEKGSISNINILLIELSPS